MGQAKKRGSYEERKATAIADNALTVRLLKEQEDAWWASLTPEEQERVAKNRVKNASRVAKFAALTAIANGASRNVPLSSLLPL